MKTQTHTDTQSFFVPCFSSCIWPWMCRENTRNKHKNPSSLDDLTSYRNLSVSCSIWMKVFLSHQNLSRHAMAAYHTFFFLKVIVVILHFGVFNQRAHWQVFYRTRAAQERAHTHNTWSKTRDCVCINSGFCWTRLHSRSPQTNITCILVMCACWKPRITLRDIVGVVSFVFQPFSHFRSYFFWPQIVVLWDGFGYYRFSPLEGQKTLHDVFYILRAAIGVQHHVSFISHAPRSSGSQSGIRGLPWSLRVFLGVASKKGNHLFWL